MNSNIILITFSLFLWIGLAFGQIPLWGQCANSQGSLGQCASGSYCKYYDAWYSQCIPGGVVTTTASPNPQPQGTIPLWGQCANSQGSLGQCASGSYCKYYDAWYSQCIPGGVVTTTTQSQCGEPCPYTFTSTEQQQSFCSNGLNSVYPCCCSGSLKMKPVTTKTTTKKKV